MAGFKFSSTSKQQLMEGLSVAIQQRLIRIPDGPVRSELESFEFVATRTGVRYAAPEGLHDDCVCALALAVEQWRTLRPALTFWGGMGPDMEADVADPAMAAQAQARAEADVMHAIVTDGVYWPGGQL